MRLRFLTALLALTALSTSAQNSPTPAPSAVTPRPLTLDDAVALALDKNFDLKLQRFSTESARDSLVIADAFFDTSLSLSAARSYRQSTDGVSSQTGMDTRVGASRRIATGGTVSGSGSLDRTRLRPDLTAGINPAYDSDVAFSVRQPLLQGAGLAANRAAIDRARLGITRADYDFQDAVLRIIRSVESAYYALSFARSQLEVRRFSLEVAEKLLEENRTRRQIGTAIDIDVLQAEVGVANARRALLQAEQTALNNEDALLALINPFEFSVSPGQLVLPELTPASVSFDRSYKLARERAPELASAQLSVEQQKLDLLTAKKDRLPVLDVGAALGYNARESTYRRAATDVWGSDGYNWQIDATLSLPWGLRAEKARHRQALTNLNREQLRLKQLDQDILVQVRAAIRSVETNEESVRIAVLATKLSEEQYNAEKARYDNGLSTFRRVQEAKEDLDTARINELQAKVALRNALSDLARLEASSLTRYRITLAP
jgi:outer membrane protein